MSPLPLALTFNDVLLSPQYSDIKSRSDVSLTTHLTPKKTIDFPVIATNMDTLVGVDMAIAMSKSGSVALYPRFAPTDIQITEVKQILDAGCFIVPCVGIKPGEMERAQKLIGIGINILMVDVAHAHQQTCLDFVKELKVKFPGVELIVGSVATYESAKALCEVGADTLEVGVGSGSVCTTRIMTGSGMPQLTAILECSRAAREFDRLVLANGGMKNSGDVVKALAAGADTVMSSNLFAGCLESPGDIKEIDGKKYKFYNGSTSAVEKQRQFQKNSTEKSADFTKYVEGVERLVPVRGPVAEIIEQLDKGIRSGFTYSGAMNIMELHEKARFVQVTSSVIFENNNRNLTQF